MKFQVGLLLASTLWATVACSHNAGGGFAASTYDLTDGHLNLVGSAEVAWMPGTWNGDQTQAAYASDVLALATDGSLSKTEFRQVGTAGDPGTPFPTLCLYRQTAPSYVVYSLNGSGFPYQLRFSAKTVELVPDVRNSQSCTTFIERAQALVSVGNYVSGTTITTEAGNQFTDDHGENFNRQ